MVHRHAGAALAGEAHRARASSPHLGTEAPSSFGGRHAFCTTFRAARSRAGLTSHALTLKEIAMTLKTLIAAAVAAAFAWPLAAGADDKSSTGASAGSDKSGAGASASTEGKASAGATKDDGGAEAMFKALDKNKDGFISKEEAKGTPHDKDFDKLDKNGDGKLSREEHAAAPEHAGKAKSSGAGGSPSVGATSSGSMSSESSSAPSASSPSTSGGASGSSKGGSKY
jgi:hypothetical protein